MQNAKVESPVTMEDADIPKGSLVREKTIAARPHIFTQPMNPIHIDTIRVNGSCADSRNRKNRLRLKSLAILRDSSSVRNIGANSVNKTLKMHPKVSNQRVRLRQMTLRSFCRDIVRTYNTRAERLEIISKSQRIPRAKFLENTLKVLLLLRDILV